MHDEISVDEICVEFAANNSVRGEVGGGINETRLAWFDNCWS